MNSNEQTELDKSTFRGGFSRSPISDTNFIKRRKSRQSNTQQLAHRFQNIPLHEKFYY